MIIKNNEYIFKLYDYSKATSVYIKNSTYSNDNIIIHRNKDIIKLFYELLNNDDPNIKKPPKEIFLEYSYYILIIFINFINKFTIIR